MYSTQLNYAPPPLMPLRESVVPRANFRVGDAPVFLVGVHRIRILSTRRAYGGYPLGAHGRGGQQEFIFGLAAVPPLSWIRVFIIFGGERCFLTTTESPHA
jgi:hypothetical protein